MQIGEEVLTWRSQIDGSGRLLIPAESRQAMRWDRGTDVVIESDGFSLRVVTLDQFTREVQAMFGRSEADEPLWSDELIAERKREAEREQGSD